MKKRRKRGHDKLKTLEIQTNIEVMSAWSLDSEITDSACNELRMMLSNLLPPNITFRMITLKELNTVSLGYVKCRKNEPKKKQKYQNNFARFYEDTKHDFDALIKLNYCFGIYFNNILIGCSVYGDAILLGTTPYSSDKLFSNTLKHCNNKFNQFKYDFPELYQNICINNKHGDINNYRNHFGFDKFDILVMDRGYIDKQYQHLGLAKILFLYLYLLGRKLQSKYILLTCSNQLSMYAAAFDCNHNNDNNNIKIYGKLPYTELNSNQYDKLSKYFDSKHSQDFYAFYWIKILDQQSTKYGIKICLDYIQSKFAPTKTILSKL